MLLGYVKESSHITQQMDFGADVVFGDSEHTYLTMFLTIEPQLVSPEPVVEKVKSVCVSVLVTLLSVCLSVYLSV